MVSCKLELPGDDWESDPEGTSIAQALNQHLPSEARLFLGVRRPSACVSSASQLSWTATALLSCTSCIAAQAAVHFPHHAYLTLSGRMLKLQPVQVRVLSVQKVGSRFDARSLAGPRTYAYYLPAWLLSPGADPESGESRQQHAVSWILML